MKKLFLVFGIVSAYSVSAQQKDLFDINNHIKSNIDKAKTRAEKNKAFSFPLNLERTYAFTNPLDMVFKPRSSYILPNGDRVIISSIDNMPVVVTDIKMFKTMPSVEPDINQFRTMPNAGRTQLRLLSEGPNSQLDQIIPSPLLEKMMQHNGKH